MGVYSNFAPSIYRLKLTQKKRSFFTKTDYLYICQLVPTGKNLYQMLDIVFFILCVKFIIGVYSKLAYFDMNGSRVKRSFHVSSDP